MFSVLKKQYTYSLVIGACSLLILACGDGGNHEAKNNALDNSQTENIVQDHNLAPIANAGADIHALETQQVSLNAEASSDRDGSIVSYQWTQKMLGTEPIINIENSRSLASRVTIPAINEDLDFAIVLTVTDDKGSSSTDEVIIHSRKLPKVEISKVFGNTIGFQSQAQFSVRLTSQPKFNVDISVASTDPNEGITNVNNLRFTPDNFNRPQIVTVIGQNANSTSINQNYAVVFSSVSSSDPLYQGLTIQPLTMAGVILAIDGPTGAKNLLPNIQARISPIVSYTGKRPLNFTLKQGPTAMVIDAATGVLTWTPPQSAAGTSLQVVIEVTDGVLTSQHTISIKVLMPKSVQSVVLAGKLLVTDTNSNLHSLAIGGSVVSRSQFSKLPKSNVTIDDLTVLPMVEAFATSESMHFLTDVFMVNAKVDNTQTISIEFPKLPDGVAPEHVNLYVYIHPDDAEQAFWSPVSVYARYTQQAGSYLFESDVKGFEGPLIWGYHRTTPAMKSAISQSSSNEKQTNFPNSSLTREPASASCESSTTVAGDYVCISPLFPIDLKAYIQHFGHGVRWGNLSVEQLASWVFFGRTIAEELGFSLLQQDLIVNIEPMPTGDIAYINTDESEQLTVLHLTDDNAVSADELKTAVIHVFTHKILYELAKVVSDEGGFNIDLIQLANPKYQWLIEALAIWLEDYAFDGVNSYRKKFVPITRMLEQGLSGLHNGQLSISKQGEAFGLIKLLENQCPQFITNLRSIIKDIFLGVSKGDSFNQNLVLIENALLTAQCDFGSQLGSTAKQKSSIESATIWYQNASLFAQDMSLLDDNEDKDPNDFIATSYQFAQGSHLWMNTVKQWVERRNKLAYELAAINVIPPLAAYSFYINAVDGYLPEDYLAWLKIQTKNNRALLVSVTSDDSEFKGSTRLGQNPHISFLTTDTDTFYYDFGRQVPRLFVTLLNQDRNNVVEIDKISFNIDQNYFAAPKITHPLNGDNLDKRLLTLTGNDIAVTTNTELTFSSIEINNDGMVTQVPIDKADDSFEANLINALGTNSIEVRALASTPAGLVSTLPAKISVNGNTGTTDDAILPSKILIALLWHKNDIQLDLYATDPNGVTVWANNQYGSSQIGVYGQGKFIDYISYYDKQQAESLYQGNGSFHIDIHNKASTGAVNFSLYVIFDADTENKQLHRFDSKQPLINSDASQGGPNGVGSSRLNDVVTIDCDSDKKCRIVSFNDNVLVKR